MGKHGDLVRILTICAYVSVFAVDCIASIVSGDSLFFAATALVLLFTLWANDNVLEQEECVEA